MENKITQKEIINRDNCTIHYEVVFTNTSGKWLTQDEYDQIDNLIRKKIGEFNLIKIAT